MNYKLHRLLACGLVCSSFAMDNGHGGGRRQSGIHDDVRSQQSEMCGRGALGKDDLEAAEEAKFKEDCATEPAYIAVRDCCDTFPIRGSWLVSGAMTGIAALCAGYGWGLSKKIPALIPNVINHEVPCCSAQGVKWAVCDNGMMNNPGVKVYFGIGQDSQESSNCAVAFFDQKEGVRFVCADKEVLGKLNKQITAECAQLGSGEEKRDLQEMCKIERKLKMSCRSIDVECSVEEQRCGPNLYSYHPRSRLGRFARATDVLVVGVEQASEEAVSKMIADWFK